MIWVRHFSIILFMSLGLTPCARAELSLEQMMQRAVEYHPLLQAGQYAEASQHLNEKIAQSAYYPQISAMALATTGFPGSAGATGVAGLMGSPFHKGPSAGLLLEQNIWDFGRTTNNVLLAEKETDLAKKESLVSGLRVAEAAQEAYFTCSRDRSLAETYSRIVYESSAVQKEVDNFVRVGQRSVVDRVLAKSQTEEVRTLAEDYKIRVGIDNQKLAYLTGQKGTDPICPLLNEKLVRSIRVSSAAAVSPLVSRAQARTAVAQTQKSLAQTDFNPKVVGLASVGWMNDTELGVPMQNYSAGIALILPLFEGFKTASQVKKFELRTIENERQTDAARFAIDEANLTYDQAIESAQLRISHLKEELQIAETGFETAKKRYIDLQGTLVDLREAIRNLSRTSSQLDMAWYEFATQRTGRALLNGQWNSIINSYMNRPLP
jgi:outer membrane protein